MPELVLFHGPQALTPRLTAAICLGRLPARRPPVGYLIRTLAGLDGGEPAHALLRPAPGLRLEGQDAANRPFLSLAAGAGPGVVERAFTGLAGLTGVRPESYLLVGAPPLPLWLRACARLCGAWGARPLVALALWLVWPGAAARARQAAERLPPVPRPVQPPDRSRPAAAAPGGRA